MTTRKKQSVADAIPEGRENAITRLELATRLRMPDREVRRQIEQARLQTVEEPAAPVILVDYDGRGYWRTKDLDEMEACYRRERRRWLNQYQTTIKPLRDRLKAAGRDV